MKMKVLVFFALVTSFLPADTGGWSTDFRIDGGPIYSVIENPDIQLEKEVLTFEAPGDGKSGKTRVNFLFRNTKNEQITLEAGFPVQISLPMYKYNKPANPGKSYYALDSDPYSSMTSVFSPIIFALFKDAERIEKWDKYAPELLIPEKSIIGKKERELIPLADFAARFPNVIPFTIRQDGKAVDITAVLIEREYRAERGILEVRFHFRHSLVFPKSGSSEIDVEYSHFILQGVKVAPSGLESYQLYQWDYIIGTGRTWKGPINNLYFMTDDSFAAVLPKQFAALESFGSWTIFGAGNYEPSARDILTVSFSSPNRPSNEMMMRWFDKPRNLGKPEGPKQPFVKVLGASSFLPEKTTIYTKEGVIRDIGFGPQNLVDGIRESAWCENVKGSGIGEWVEVELSKHTTAVNVQNGFNKCLYNAANRDIGTYFGKNNRVKSLEIRSVDGQPAGTIELEDIKEMQYIPLNLKKGVYKVVIKEVYRGTAWDDTCLGELTFLDPENDPLSNDPYLKGIIFR
jgi:hypothetical protein